MGKQVGVIMSSSESFYKPFIHKLYENLGRHLVLPVLSKSPPSIQRDGLALFSQLCRFSLQHQNPNDYTWKSLEYIYQNNPRYTPSHLLDHAILNMEASSAARSRLQTIKTRLVSLIEQYTNDKGRVEILDVGTGSGTGILTSLGDLGDMYGVHVVGIDQNADAVAYAIEQADRFGMNGHVDFLRQDYRHISKIDGTFDIILLIGVLDYLKQDHGIRIIRNLRNKLKHNGTLLTSNITGHELRWASDAIGWVMNYKNIDQVRTILELAGLEGVKVYYEQTGIIAIGEGQRPASLNV